MPYGVISCLGLAPGTVSKEKLDVFKQFSLLLISSQKLGWYVGVLAYDQSWFLPKKKRAVLNLKIDIES